MILADRGTRSKISTQRLGGQERWYALSAYAFQIEAVHGQEGYTILRLPSKEIHEGNDPSNKTEGEKITEPAKDYVLWELAHNSDGCF